MENHETLETRDWSQMPRDILDLFCKRLTIPDQLRFGCVCKWWWFSSTSSNKTSYLWFPNTPWLINDDESSAHYQVFSFTDQKQYNIPKPFDTLGGSFIFGSFKGWLAIQSEADKDFLLNLFSKVRVELPPRTAMPDFLQYTELDTPVAFAISTCANLNPIYAALVTFGGGLAWCKIGDKAWKGYRQGGEGDENYGNIAFVNEKLYAIDRGGKKIDIFKVDDESLVLLLLGSIEDSTSHSPHAQPMAMMPPVLFNTYLVESEGNLLVVKRYYSDTNVMGPTIGFDVFKVDENCSPHKLVEVNSLEDQVLFMGDTICESLRAEHCPGLEPGCICFTGYYTDYYSYELGKFSVEYGTMVKMPMIIDPDLDPPMWLLPRFAFECNNNCKCNPAMQ